MDTYTHVCAHRGDFMQQADVWGGNPPGVPYTSPTDGNGRLAPGPAGEDREAAFRDWHRAEHGTEHTDPCDGCAVESAAGPRIYRAADQGVIEDGGVLRAVVIVDDERPAGDNYRIQLLAPIAAEIDQAVVWDTYWGGNRPPGWRTVRPAPSAR